MRQIKFRGKRIDNGEWVYGCLVYTLDPAQSEDVVKQAFIREPLANIGNTYEVYPESVGEFSGLYDCNRVEIYDGDKVSVPYVTPDGIVTDTVDYIATVVFKSGSFYITGDVEGVFVLLSNWCVQTGVNYISNYGQVAVLSNKTRLTVTGNIHTKTETK